MGFSRRPVPEAGKLRLFWISLWLAVPCLYATPRIASPEPVYDFGSHAGTSVLTHTFVIENRGESELVTGHIHACCGATARIETNTVPAGEQTRLHVTLSLAGRRGAQTKHFFIASNDPATPLYRVTMKGTALQEAAARSERSPYQGDAQGGAVARVIVDYFHEPGCPSCRRIEGRILPDVLEAFGEQIDLRKWNVSEMEAVMRLMAYQDALGLVENHPVLMVVDYRQALNGVNAIETGLRDAVAMALSAWQDPDYAGPTPIPVPDARDGLASGQSRLETFSLPAILVAGLIDGLNPCAITALTFLMSLLAASKVKGHKLLLLGLSYCVAAFLTYLTIGLGLLRAFGWFHAVPLLRHGVETILLAGLLIVAFLSFRDAWRFSRSHRADAVQVKLPKPIMRLSHTIMRHGVRAKHLVLGGFLSGVAVTGVDSICTGQLYIPTLALMIRMADGSQSLHAWQLLIAYNAMFIVPLLSVFLLVWTGLSNQTLQAWSKRHVVPGKILMGLLMLTLAVGLVVLRSLNV